MISMKDDIMKTALELLLAAQTKINASGTTETVCSFLREFFADLAYTEDASDYLFTLHHKEGGYYFKVMITLNSVDVKWDVSKDGLWEGIDKESSLLFREFAADTIINHIEAEFQTMASRCFVINPELKPVDQIAV